MPADGQVRPKFLKPLDDRDERRQALLDQAKSGSREALGGLFTEYQPMMRSFILGQLPRKLAGKVLDDLAQDTFLKATAAFARFVGEHVAQFTKWLIKICRSVLADFLRKHQRADAHELLLDEADPEQAGSHGYRPRQPSPDEAVAALETAGMVLAALNRLAADERQIVIWHVSHRLSLADIAARLLYTDDAVRRAFQHALTNLRKRLVQVGLA